MIQSDKKVYLIQISQHVGLHILLLYSSDNIYIYLTSIYPSRYISSRLLDVGEANN